MLGRDGWHARVPQCHASYGGRAKPQVAEVTAAEMDALLKKVRRAHARAASRSANASEARAPSWARHCAVTTC
jgi:hypothetical protein